MFANGNGGRTFDDCAADGYSSSIYTISVGAIGVTGAPSNFDEQCSAKMVVTYVTGLDGYSAVVRYLQCIKRTAPRYKDYTNGFAYPVIIDITILSRTSIACLV